MNTSAFITIRQRWFFAAALAGLAGCAPEDATLEPTEESSASVEALSARASALRVDQLQGVAWSVSGEPLFISNNPETVDTPGILATTKPGLRLGRRAGPSLWRGATITDEHSTGLVTSSNAGQAGCPAGAYREFGVYTAHIATNAMQQGYISFAVEVATNEPVSVQLTGQLKAGRWATNDPNFVSAAAMYEHAFTRQSTATVRLERGEFRALSTMQVNERERNGNWVSRYFDGRMTVKVTGGCVYPFMIAHSGATLTAVPSTWATGNIAPRGWYQGGGEGRAAGMYAGSRLAASAEVRLTEASSAMGIRLNAAADSIGALVRHADSAPTNFGNYGTVQDVTVAIRNTTSACTVATTEFVPYAATSRTANGRMLFGAPTYGWYAEQYARTADRDVPTVFWNGSIRRFVVNSDGSERSTEPLKMVLGLPIPAFRSRPAGLLVREMRQWLHTFRISPGSVARVRYEVPVPGLISAPGTIVVSNEPCPANR